MMGGRRTLLSVCPVFDTLGTDLFGFVRGSLGIPGIRATALPGRDLQHTECVLYRLHRAYIRLGWRRLGKLHRNDWRSTHG